MSLLDDIQSPEDLKKLPPEKLPELAQEIRRKIIETTSKNGGHVGPNLGVVELTIALHRVFSTPRDAIIFDVSHQCYAHKILTGRGGARFDKLRKTGGIAGFCRRAESEHDAFGAGHAGTALSAALGFAAARDLAGGSEHVVAVVGDAAITNGTTLEALNNIAAHSKRLIVVLNDNKWSIDRNVGAVADYLNKFITTPAYNKATRRLRSFLEKIPGGSRLIRIGSAWKREKKNVLTDGSSPLFENFNLRYLGPIDGHNIAQLISYLEFSKNSDKPILLHVRTQKGRGLKAAVANPEKFHGCAPFDPETGEILRAEKGAPAWQKVFGETLVSLARQDKKIVGITAAMPSGTSLDLLKRKLPSQYFDVGIAEGHAVVFAAGMAAKGFKPCVAIYSSFMQRATDMVIHDVCLQNLPVVFCLDRAGLSPQDGATHHGLYDISMMRAFPNLVIMQPKDEAELADMLAAAFSWARPVIIRYPRGRAFGVPVGDVPKKIALGESETLEEGTDGGEVCIWALGGPALQVAKTLATTLASERGGKSPTLVNARFCKPLDAEKIAQQATRAKLFVTVENHALAGGFGSAFLEKLSDLGLCVPVERIGWRDEFVCHATSADELREHYGLSDKEVAARVLSRLQAR
ncbi:MAG: 1-deoxy-D-xylulose-5-phosphate synthase [Opitutae bacterium]|nr:1-deoxy-D-xylulose-5-phosphate synthase [Opitutae bacterium]MCD8298276.1 1-deoxy-D-xylulose-5-phosphate synthase [Opitutae bacterium]